MDLTWQDDLITHIPSQRPIRNIKRTYTYYHLSLDQEDKKEPHHYVLTRAHLPGKKTPLT